MAAHKNIDETKVSIYIHPNPEIRSFLTFVDIFPPRLEHYKKPFEKTEKEGFKGLGFIESQMIRDLMDIPGILEMRVKPKEIRILKEESFSWENIGRKVIKTVESALKRKNFKDVKQEGR